MKTFKSILFALLLLMILHPQQGWGQKFYFKAALGGAVGVNGSAFYRNSFYYYDSTAEVVKSKVKFSSLGNGISLSLTGGWNMMKNVSFELSLGYNKRFPVIFHNENYYYISNISFKENWENKISGHSFFMIPAIKISAGSEKLNPYCKVGFIISKGALKETDSVYIGGFVTRGFTQKYVHTTDFFYGLKTAIGCEFPLAKKVKMFCEMAYDDIDFIPEKTTMLSYSHDGTNLMGRLCPMERDVEYVDEIDQTVPADRSKPLQALTEKLSMNTVSLNIGVKF